MAGGEEGARASGDADEEQAAAASEEEGESTPVACGVGAGAAAAVHTMAAHAHKRRRQQQPNSQPHAPCSLATESSALDSDHAARSGGSSSSSEDEDDEQPLAQRASSAAAARTPSKPASTRTRVNRFPKIKRSERCGRCAAPMISPSPSIICRAAVPNPAASPCRGFLALLPLAACPGPPLPAVTPLRDRRCHLDPPHPHPTPHPPTPPHTHRCENCLNPQRKKACIVARQRMEQRLNAHGGAAVSAVPTGAWRAAATAAPPTADDPFTRALTGILSSSGGVLQERHVPLLLRLVRRAASKAHRAALLVVLQLSAGEVLRGAVAGGLLLELQGWLGEYVAEGRQALVQKVLACLDKMPVTLAALQPPCELGKVVGRLRKHEAFGSAVVEPAKRLVARWKEVVERSAQTGGAARSALLSACRQAGQPSCNRSPRVVCARPLWRQRVVVKCPVAFPCTAHGDLPLCTSTVPRLAVDKPPLLMHPRFPWLACSGASATSVPVKPPPAAPMPKLVAAPPPLDPQPSATLAVGEDGDLFKTTDKQRTGPKGAAPAIGKKVGELPPLGAVPAPRAPVWLPVARCLRLPGSELAAW